MTPYITVMEFKKWLVKEGYATGGKIGLYPPISDALGQYPPLYAVARIPDVITYIYLAKKHQPSPQSFKRSASLS